MKQSKYYLTVVSLLSLVLFSLTLLPLEANAARGGKGGKQTKAVVSFSVPAVCGSELGLTEVKVGFDESQCFSYLITVPDLDGKTLFDEITADFNLSGDGESEAVAEAIVIDEDLFDDFDHNGIYVDGSCDVYDSQPDSVVNNNPPPQEPEFIVIQGGPCTVRVWVETALHRGQSDCSLGSSDESCEDPEDILVFRPASCTTLKQETAGDPVIDGDGINAVIDSFNMHLMKMFDTSGDPMELADGATALLQVLQAYDGNTDGIADCVQ